MTGAALGVIAFLAPQVASAQCEQRLERAVAAIGTLSDSVDRRVHDQLIDLHDEAGGNEGRCVEAGVARMEDLLRRNGAQIEGDVGPAATGRSGGGGASTSGGGGGSRPSLVQVTPPTPFSRTVEQGIAALPAAQQAEARDVGRYVENIRGFGVQISGDLAAQAPAQANAVALTTNTAIVAAEALQKTLMQPSHIEMLYDQLVDSVRDAQQADRALSAAYQAVLRERSSSTSLDRLEAALAHSLAMQAKLDQLEGRAAQGKYDALAEGRPEGYAAALAALEAKHQQENRALDAQCDARNQMAQQELAKDYLSGNRESNAIGAAIADCQAISFPVWQRQKQEADALEARFAALDDLAPPRPRRNPPRSNPPRTQTPPRPAPNPTPPPPPPPAAEQPPKPLSPQEIAQQRRDREQALSDARRALDRALTNVEENPNSHEAQVKLDGAKMVVQHADEAYRGHLAQYAPSELADYESYQYSMGRRTLRPIEDIQDRVGRSPAPSGGLTPTSAPEAGLESAWRGLTGKGPPPAQDVAPTTPVERSTAGDVDSIRRGAPPEGGLTPTPAPEAGLESAWRGLTPQPRSSSQEVSPTSPVPSAPRTVDDIGRNAAPEGGLPATPAPEAGLASAWRGLMTPPASSQPAAPASASPTGSEP